MELDKSRIIKECKYLLRLVNCEAIIDTEDETLYDMLFKSHNKKKMLLSWLIQQLYSPECCSSNSLDDLISSFISKQHLSNFLTGKMPMLEQYKRWKLIMTVLHQRQRRKIFPRTVDFDKEIESCLLLEKYERIWNEKLRCNLSYVGLVSGKEARPNADELRLLLQTAKDDGARFDSQPFTQLPNVNSRLLNMNSREMLLETLRNSDRKLNNIIGVEFESFFKSNIPINQLEDNLKYEQLNQRILKDTEEKLQILIENTGLFNKLIHGVENLQFDKAGN